MGSGNSIVHSVPWKIRRYLLSYYHLSPAHELQVLPIYHRCNLPWVSCRPGHPIGLTQICFYFVVLLFPLRLNPENGARCKSLSPLSSFLLYPPRPFQISSNCSRMWIESLSTIIPSCSTGYHGRYLPS